MWLKKFEVEKYGHMPLGFVWAIPVVWSEPNPQRTG